MTKKYSVRFKLFLFLFLVLVAEFSFIGFHVQPVFAQNTTIELWVDAFDSSFIDWTTAGASPYLGAIDNPTNIISTATAGAAEGYFGYTNVSGSAVSIVSVTLCVYAKTAGNDGANIYVRNSTNTYTLQSAQAFTSSYAWYNYTATAYFPTPSEVNSSRIYVDYWYTGSKSTTSIDASLLSVTYSTTAPPTYTTRTETPIVPLGGDSLTVSVYWTAVAGNMSMAVAEWNYTGSALQNSTWYSYPTGIGGQTAGWANITITTPNNQTSDYYLRWRQYANNTDNAWTVTSFREILVWRSIPTQGVSDWDMGEAAETPRALYYAGAKNVIYIVYQNTSTSPWTNVIRAFDVNASTKTPNYILGNTTIDDGHVAPEISVLPDGRLLYMYGYGATSQYYLSTYSAKTETDVWKLISTWDAVANFPDTISYPHAVAFDDRTFIHGRVSTSTSFVTYSLNQSFIDFVNANDTTWKEWGTWGSAPYLDDGDTSYISSNSLGARMGYFLFPDVDSTRVKSDLRATLYVYTTLVNRYVNVYLNTNGTDYSVGQITGTGWTSWNVSDYTSTTTKFNAAKLKLELSSSGVAGYSNVSRAYLLVNYTGFSPLQALSNIQYYDITKNGTYLLYAGIDDVEGNYGNATFAYSNDKGVTWKTANGTALTVPFFANQTMIPDPNGAWKSDTLDPILDENNKPTIAVITRSNPAYIPAQRLKMLTYSTTLGSVGTWNYTFAQDEYGNPINATDLGFFMDPWYHRPAIWTPNNQKMQKYVRLPGSTYQFHSVWSDPASNLWDAYGTVIKDSIQAYEVVNREFYLNALGNLTVGSTQQLMNKNEFWATKFTANITTTLTVARFYVNTTAANAKWQAALYDTSFNILGETDTHTLSYGSTEVGWQTYAPFMAPFPTITQGTDYWLAFRVDTDNAAYYFYNTIISPANSTLQFSLGSADVSLQEHYGVGDDKQAPATTTSWLGQTFTPSQTHNITSVSLKLFRSGNVGTVTIGIRNTDGSGKPTGGDLVNGTISSASLTTTAAWYNITMSNNNTQLQTGMKYAIVVRISGAGTLSWRYDSTNPTYSGGTYADSANSGSTWNIYESADFVFEEYGFPLLPTAEFPNAFVPTGYYNRTITMLAAPVFIHSRGLGVGEGVMSFSTPGLNTTIAGNPAYAYLFLSCGAGLSGFVFSSNNTGQWENQTYSGGLSGVEGWANSTDFILNDTSIILSAIWYANDSQNTWYTSNQYNFTINKYYLNEIMLNPAFQFLIFQSGLYHVLESLGPQFYLSLGVLWSASLNPTLGVSVSLSTLQTWSAMLVSSLNVGISLILSSVLSMLVLLSFSVTISLSIVSMWLANLLSSFSVSFSFSVITQAAYGILQSLGLSLSMTLEVLKIAVGAKTVIVDLSLSVQLLLSEFTSIAYSILSSLGILSSLSMIQQSIYGLISSLNLQLAMSLIGKIVINVFSSLNISTSLNILQKATYGILSGINVTASLAILQHTIYNLAANLGLTLNMTFSAIRTAVVDLSLTVTGTFTMLQQSIMNVLLSFNSVFSFSIWFAGEVVPTVNIAFVLAAFAVVISLTALGLFMSQRTPPEDTS